LKVGIIIDMTVPYFD